MLHCMQVVVDAKDAHTKYYVQYSIFWDVIYQLIEIMSRCGFKYCQDGRLIDTKEICSEAIIRRRETVCQHESTCVNDGKAS